jgi:hypothetical protein
MSEADNSTLVESAMEMQPVESPQEPEITEPTTAELPTTVSNQEAMTALTLSRIKRQSKQIENVTRLLGQLAAQFRGLDKKLSGQNRTVGQQVRALQVQIRVLQRQVARIKTSTAGTKRRAGRKKARKSKSRRR